MKKLFTFAALILLTQVGYAQLAATTPAVEPNPDLAVAVIDNQNFDFGKIKQGVPVTHEFSFTNKGKVPMIITNAQPSCGCTIGSWTREPIPPGGQGFVKTTFNAAGAGIFDKTVTVTANVEGGMVVLHIRGEVVVQQPN